MFSTFCGVLQCESHFVAAAQYVPAANTHKAYRGLCGGIVLTLGSILVLLCTTTYYY